MAEERYSYPIPFRDVSVGAKSKRKQERKHFGVQTTVTYKRTNRLGQLRKQKYVFKHWYATESARDNALRAPHNWPYANVRREKIER